MSNIKDGSMYVGQWISKEARHGKGTYIFRGSIFLGELQYDSWNWCVGLVNGGRFIGRWRNGRQGRGTGV
jgi:hypothetical protein